jgi:hypothetical protein
VTWGNPTVVPLVASKVVTWGNPTVATKVEPKVGLSDGKKADSSVWMKVVWKVRTKADCLAAEWVWKRAVTKVASSV